MIELIVKRLPYYGIVYSEGKGGGISAIPSLAPKPTRSIISPFIRGVTIMVGPHPLSFVSQRNC